MRKHRSALWVAALAAAALAGCSDTSGTDGGAKREGGTVTPDLPPGEADRVVLKKAGETASADFSKAGEYVIVPYSVSEVASDAIDFKVTITGSAGASVGTQSFAARLVPSQRGPVDPVFAARWARRMKVEHWLRGLAVQASRQRHTLPVNMTQPLAGAECTSSTDGKCDANEVCSNLVCASQVTINVSKFATSAQTITAVVKKKGTKAAVLVDSADTISDADAAALLDRFEKTILPRDVALFGDPILKGSSGPTASDRNGDGLIWLVLTSKTKEKDGAVGFFNAIDFSSEDAASNKADILYIDGSASPDDAMPIMAHELQHLLNYAAKVYKPQVNGGQGALEALWLDEGEAYFAEDACGFGGGNTTVLRQNVFNGDFSDKTMLITDSTPLNDQATGRGMAFLFVRYLFEQKGAATYAQDGTLSGDGTAFLQGLHTSTKQGTAAVTEALGGTFSDWKAGFDNWLAALTLSGRAGLTSLPSKFTYLPLVTDPAGAKNQIGVVVRGARQDDQGATVNLTGPNEEEITDISAPTEGQIPNATGRFYLLKGQTGTVEVKVECADQDFRFAVIRGK